MKEIGILLKKLLEEHVKLANMSWDEKERQRKPAKEILDVIGWDMKERIRKLMKEGLQRKYGQHRQKQARKLQDALAENPKLCRLTDLITHKGSSV